MSLSSRILQSTILDFRLRLLLLAALCLPCVALGGLLHALASGRPWTTSIYLVYGLLFRVPALGAVRLDEPASSALVLNLVFLFGTFGFAILLGLISEEVKATAKALRAGGAPLELYGHIVLLNFSADATAVALLRQLAADVGTPGSPLYGRPIVVLASPPPPGPAAAASTSPSAAGAGASAGGGGGDVEGPMRRIVADALQGHGTCEWHLRVGSPCRPDDLARVCAAAAAHVVLLDDPRVGAHPTAAAAGVAPCLQAQALMCLSLAMAAEQHAGCKHGRGPEALRGAPAARSAPPAAWAFGSPGRPHAPTIVVQSPADAPAPLPAPLGRQCGGPVGNFRSIAAAEGARGLLVEVRDRGIVDRLAAQTVLQPGVATVLARLFGRSGGEGAGFRWVEWAGSSPAPTAARPAVAPDATAFTAIGGASTDGGGDAAAAGLRRRRGDLLNRTLSHSLSQHSLASTAATRSAGGGAGDSDGAGRAATSRLRSASPGPSAAAHEGHGSGAAAHMPGASLVKSATGRRGVSPLALPPLGVCSSAAPFGDVRAAVEAAVAPPAAHGHAGRHHRRRRHPHAQPQQSGGPLVQPQTESAAAPPPGKEGHAPLGLGLGQCHGRGVVVCGYLSAATGSLRLNPRDASPVYPGDQLLLLVSGAGGGGSGGGARRPALLGDGGGGGGGWSWLRGSCWGSARRELQRREHEHAPDGGGAAARRGEGEAGRHGVGGDGKAREGASASQIPHLPSWHSEPLALSAGHATPEAQPAAPEGSGGDRTPQHACASRLHEAGTLPPDPSAPSAPLPPPPPPPPPPAQPLAARQRGAGPAPPASHIIVISRTAAAVREVVAGLQEFAPPGSTVALLTHGSAPPPHPHAPPLQEGTASAAVGAAATGTLAMSNSAVEDAAAPEAAVAAQCQLQPGSSTGAAALHSGRSGGGAAPGGGGGGAGVAVLHVACGCWPPGEEDLVEGGLAAATAVLLARDAELPPQQADATALAAVLQLHHSLTDPTRSPLRRCASLSASAPALALALTGGPGGGSGRAAPAEALRAPSLRAVQSLPAVACGAAGSREAAASQLQQHGCGQPQPPPQPPSQQQQQMKSSCWAEAAVGLHGVLAAAGPAAPLHVVVCLHSTRTRATLRDFMAGLTVQPPFSLEALIAEEYRALLLAGVVRQPQCHAVMTDLLSDRPGDPEVYLVPPERLLEAALAQGGPAAALSGAHEDRDHVDGRHHHGQRQHQHAGGLAPPPAAAASPRSLDWDGDWRHWRFGDAAALARVCGYTALGLLRGGGGVINGGGGGGGRGVSGLNEGDGGGGDGGGLQLAPPLDAPLSLAAGDRIVVMAAGPV